MIATLTGVITEKIGSQAVLDAAGVGYGVLLTLSDLGRVHTGERTKLYIYENIKEDSHDLFGFLVLDDKRLFEQLLSVKNVGPKVAMAVLDIGSANAVRVAIAGGDVKQLQTAKGVGKRAAEQIVVELKDKVGLEGVDLSTTGILQGEGLLMKDEAVEALVSLGYSPQDAAVALSAIDDTLPTEDRIKHALKGTF
ncbi:MAG TPA: Holliday junction branch migration protein RuvA [Candidatus Saccharimonadales bacterium]|jgi:Holliday junction DNA helicase RuvA